MLRAGSAVASHRAHHATRGGGGIMKDEFGLEENAMLNDPRSTYWPGIILTVDGNMLCAHLTTFVNLQESPAGFGETAKEAVVNLLVDMRRICRRPLWFGLGLSNTVE